MREGYLKFGEGFPETANGFFTPGTRRCTERRRARLELAVADVAPYEVTPPRVDSVGWNAERMAWFRRYHRAAAGLDGEAQEKSWAVICGGRIAGSIRLKRTGPGAVESGIWLARSYRGRGIGRRAMKLVVAEAASAGASVLEADTTPVNKVAQALLRSMGASLMQGPGTVTARLELSKYR